MSFGAVFISALQIVDIIFLVVKSLFMGKQKKAFIIERFWKFARVMVDVIVALVRNGIGRFMS